MAFSQCALLTGWSKPSLIQSARDGQDELESTPRLEPRERAWQISVVLRPGMAICKIMHAGVAAGNHALWQKLIDRAGRHSHPQNRVTNVFLQIEAAVCCCVVPWLAEGSERPLPIYKRDLYQEDFWRRWAPPGARCHALYMGSHESALWAARECTL
eukprot:1138763-Pelagomonas_calceolata.AAC.4